MLVTGFFRLRLLSCGTVFCRAMGTPFHIRFAHRSVRLARMKRSYCENNSVHKKAGYQAHRYFFSKIVMRQSDSYRTDNSGFLLGVKNEVGFNCCICVNQVGHASVFSVQHLCATLWLYYFSPAKELMAQSCTKFFRRGNFLIR